MKRLVFVVVFVGCTDLSEMADRGPPIVRGEMLTIIRRDGATVHADRGIATLAPDAAASLRGLEFAMGHTRARAVRAEGTGTGPWFLSGVVRAWVVGGDGGLDPDATANDLQTVEIEAPRMRLDPRTGTAIMDGGVRVRRGDMVMEAQRMRVTYTPDGDLAAAEAEGPVIVHAGGSLLATVGNARLDLARRVLVIPGHVRVTRGPVTLEGDGVTVDLATGGVELHAVRGRWTVSGS